MKLYQYGKPSFKNNEHIKFNISHCDGLIACAVGLEEIGVDVENIRSFDDYVVRRVCNKKEINSIYNSDDSEKTFWQGFRSRITLSHKGK